MGDVIFEMQVNTWPSGKISTESILPSLKTSKLSQKINIHAKDWIKEFHCKELPKCSPARTLIVKKHIETPNELVRNTRKGILKELDFVKLHDKEDSRQRMQRMPSSHYKRPKEVQPYTHIPRGKSGRYKPWRKVDRAAKEWAREYDPASLTQEEQLMLQRQTNNSSMGWSSLERPISCKKQQPVPLHYAKSNPWPRRLSAQRKATFAKKTVVASKKASNLDDFLEMKLAIYDLTTQNNHYMADLDKILDNQQAAKSRSFQMLQRRQKNEFKKLHRKIVDRVERESYQEICKKKRENMDKFLAASDKDLIFLEVFYYNPSADSATA